MSDESDLTPPPMDDNPATPPAPPSSSGTPGALPVPGQGKLAEKDDKTFGMLGHLLGIFTAFVGPLVIFLIKKDESPYVEDQAKEALNFQILMTIGYIASSILTTFLIGCFTYPAFIIVNIVFGIMATMKANEGTAYRYPFTLRIIK